MKSGPVHIFFLISVLVMCRIKYCIFLEDTQIIKD